MPGNPQVRTLSGESVLLPCPFCDEPPTTNAVGDGRRGLMIECFTDGCVNPHVSYYDHDAAIAAWNRRAPTPSSAGNNEVGSRSDVDEGAELTTEKRRSPGTDAAPTDSTRSGAEPQGEG